MTQFILDQGFDLECSNSYGTSALGTAIESLNLEVCELLLRNGANVNKKGRGNLTPLILAIGYHSAQALVQVLLDYGADVTAMDVRRFYFSQRNGGIEIMQSF